MKIQVFSMLWLLTVITKISLAVCLYLIEFLSLNMTKRQAFFGKSTKVDWGLVNLLVTLLTYLASYILKNSLI